MFILNRLQSAVRLWEHNIKISNAIHTESLLKKWVSRCKFLNKSDKKSSSIKNCQYSSEYKFYEMDQ